MFNKALFERFLESLSINDMVPILKYSDPLSPTRYRIIMIGPYTTIHSWARESQLCHIICLFEESVYKTKFLHEGSANNKTNTQLHNVGYFGENVVTYAIFRVVN